MNKEEFINELKKISIEVTEDELNKLEEYYNLLIEWNKKVNLTRIVEKKEVYLKHFYDSLTLYKDVDLNNDLYLCDIGTGAGFPGIVLKIFFPNLNITLVDSLQKRINFLNIVIEKLNLKNINTIHIRAEDFCKNNKNKYDIVTSRAVSKLNNLLDYCIPIVKKNGYFVPMKAKCKEEIEEAQEKIKQKNLIIEKIDEFVLPFEESKRTILKIKKVK